MPVSSSRRGGVGSGSSRHSNQGINRRRSSNNRMSSNGSSNHDDNDDDDDEEDTDDHDEILLDWIDESEQDELRQVLKYLVLLNSEAVQKAFKYVRRGRRRRQRTRGGDDGGWSRSSTADNGAATAASAASSRRRRRDRRYSNSNSKSNSIDHRQDHRDEDPPAAFRELGRSHDSDEITLDSTFMQHPPQAVQYETRPQQEQQQQQQQQPVVVVSNVPSSVKKRHRSRQYSNEEEGIHSSGSTRERSSQGGQRRLMVLCTSKPSSRKQGEDQDRAMRLCKQAKIVPNIILKEKKPDQAREFLRISKIAVYPQFFLQPMTSTDDEKTSSNDEVGEGISWTPDQASTLLFLGDYDTVNQLYLQGQFNSNILKPPPPPPQPVPLPHSPQAHIISSATIVSTAAAAADAASPSPATILTLSADNENSNNITGNDSSTNDNDAKHNDDNDNANVATRRQLNTVFRDDYEESSDDSTPIHQPTEVAGSIPSDDDVPITTDHETNGISQNLQGSRPEPGRVDPNDDQTAPSSIGSSSVGNKLVDPPPSPPSFAEPLSDGAQTAVTGAAAEQKRRDVADMERRGKVPSFNPALGLNEPKSNAPVSSLSHHEDTMSLSVGPRVLYDPPSAPVTSHDLQEQRIPEEREHENDQNVTTRTAAQEQEEVKAMIDTTSNTSGNASEKKRSGAVSSIRSTESIDEGHEAEDGSTIRRSPGFSSEQITLRPVRSGPGRSSLGGRQSDPGDDQPPPSPSLALQNAKLSLGQSMLKVVTPPSSLSPSPQKLPPSVKEADTPMAAAEATPPAIIAPSLATTSGSGQPAWMQVLAGQKNPTTLAVATSDSVPEPSNLSTTPAWMANSATTTATVAVPASAPASHVAKDLTPVSAATTTATVAVPASAPASPVTKDLTPVSSSPAAALSPSPSVATSVSLPTPTSPDPQRGVDRHRSLERNKYPQGGACYLVYDAVQGELNIYYSEVPIIGAVGVWTSPDIQAFKDAQGLGKSELIGTCANGVQDRQQYYNGWCQFVKAAKSMDATVTILDVGVPVDFYLYGQDGETRRVRSGDFETKTVDGVACVPRNADFNMDLKGKKWSKAAKRIGAVALFRSLSMPATLGSTTIASSQYHSTATTMESAAPEMQSAIHLHVTTPIPEDEEVSDEGTITSITPSPAPAPVIAQAPTPIQIIEPPRTPTSVATATAPEPASPTTPGTRNSKGGYASALAAPSPPGGACYLVYEPDSSGRLVEHYSQTPIEDAIGRWVPAGSKKIAGFKFKQNLGKTILIGNCSAGVQGRKNYASGWCQFVRSARVMQADVMLWDPVAKGLMSDVYLYMDDNRPTHQTVKLIPGIAVNVEKVLGVACIPKNTPFYEGMTVDILKWLADGSTYGASSRF